ncbi:hypothetical protein OG205_09920 [Lentzea sp. NBC_00516]|uniref:hypothetical protein n=1 Tax=Lentzea sp. NBC_00516 TaxID=2903582 RepID=UPI002E7FD565|nr:hypothetical protein [Lentzea sp. NBC_00516]WUD27289.1 hypothetical protein OG205_09920 [Lentzea sp. NBC_00516]
MFGLGQGAAAVQIAAARGATVIGTASKANHDFLRELGARPVTYGEGLAERVTAAAPEASTPRWTPPAPARSPTSSPSSATPRASRPWPPSAPRPRRYPKIDGCGRNVVEVDRPTRSPLGTATR